MTAPARPGAGRSPVVPFDRAVATAAVVLAALAIAGCGGGGDPVPRTPSPPGATGTTEPDPPPPPPTDEEQIEDLLRERAAALEGGDRRAYVATAAGAQRRRDRQAIGRASLLRLRDVELDPGPIDVTGSRATVHVATAYGVAGVRGEFRSGRRVDLVRAGGRWRVRRVRGGRGLPPWEVARFRERRTRHFVVLAPAVVPLDDLVPALEAGYATMRTQLPQGRLRRRYVVVVPSDPAQAQALTSEIRGLATLVAISDGVVNELGSERRVSSVVSLRLVVVWTTYAALGVDEQRRTIAHELTHAALAGSTSGRTPAWLAEGVAMYVSDDRRPAPPGAELAALSRPDAIARLTGLAQATAYAASSAAAFEIADRFGSRRLFALHDAFNDPELRGRPGRRLVNRALRRELGIGLADLGG